MGLSTDFQSQCLVSSSFSSLPRAPWRVSLCPPPTGSLARLAGSRSRSRVGATASAPRRGASPRRGAPPPSTSTAPTRPPDSGASVTPPAQDLQGQAQPTLQRNVRETVQVPVHVPGSDVHAVHEGGRLPTGVVRHCQQHLWVAPGNWPVGILR